MPNKIFVLPIVAVTALIIGLFIFAKFGPGIPISMTATNKTDLFTVTGEGKASGVPDIVEINLGITINSSSVAQAQSQANSIINKISTEIKKLGVGEKDIQTTSYNLRRDFEKKDYVADIILLVKFHQFDKLDQAIDAATAAGANQIGGLSFTLDDATREKLEAQARKQAIDKAKKKAAEIAAASGLNLGRLINVSERTSPIVRPMPMVAKGEGAGQSPLGGAQIEPGTTEISIFVTLSYETR